MKKIITLLLIFTIKIGLGQSIKNVSAEEFQKMIHAKKGILIDLRTDNEIKSKGMIKDAQQINFLAKDAELIIDKLDKKKTYLIYCAAGGRSSDCAELMAKTGFKEVVNLEKGFDDWKRKGFPVEMKK